MEDETRQGSEISEFSLELRPISEHSLDDEQNESQHQYETLLSVLWRFHESHLQARERFQVHEMNAPRHTIRQQGTIQSTPSPSSLKWILSSITQRVFSSSPFAKYEKIFLERLEISSLGDLLSRLLYEIFKNNIHKAAGNSHCVGEAVLGWAAYAPTSLPLAEAALLSPSDLADRHASSILLGSSHILNALTVSPSQGQLEWLGLVADTLKSDIERDQDLDWYSIVVSKQSPGCLGCKSMVMEEIMMTETTIERPNELFNLLNGGFSLGETSQITYRVRRCFALQYSYGILQPARAARKLMKKIYRALHSPHNPRRRKDLYESWIKSEWDVPSILFCLEDIRQIIKDLDDGANIDTLADQILQLLIVRYRGLRAVCARARCLARRLAMFENIRGLRSRAPRIRTMQDLNDSVQKYDQIIHQLLEIENFPPNVPENEYCFGGAQEAKLWEAWESVSHIVSNISELAKKNPSFVFTEELAETWTQWDWDWDDMLSEGEENALLFLKNPIENSFYLFEGKDIENDQMVGTDASAVKRPRILWELVFNSTIEANYTSLPWVAVSHSWKQAFGSHYCFINERKNIIPWATRMDLNNVRQAMLQTGMTIGWMDKICLRQRGIDGYDSALRYIDWAIDIPLMDVAYSQASRILVYLEGAGRPILQHCTFREHESWLHRKWTAQEVPRGVPLVIGNADNCVTGDFFDISEKLIEPWHQARHNCSSQNTYQCVQCYDIRDRFLAIKNCRNVPETASEIEQLKSVWDLVKGRSAGCDADKVFSLLALLRVKKRPLYDHRYPIEQAVHLVEKRLSNEQLEVLKSPECAQWFDGMFSKTSSLPVEIYDQLIAFRPQEVHDLRKLDCHTTRFFHVDGWVSQKILSFQAADLISDTGGLAEQQKRLNAETRLPHCHCQRALSAYRSFEDIRVLGYFVIWHGQEFCCVALPNTVLTHVDMDLGPFISMASHLLLSENRLWCILMRQHEKDLVGQGIPTYEILGVDRALGYNASSRWTELPSGLQRQTSIVTRETL